MNASQQHLRVIKETRKSALQYAVSKKEKSSVTGCITLKITTKLINMMREHYDNMINTDS